jgi:hypothetical protein
MPVNSSFSCLFTVAAPRGGHVPPPPVLFRVNFLICPSPVRKKRGGDVCNISPVI